MNKKNKITQLQGFLDKFDLGIKVEHLEDMYQSEDIPNYLIENIGDYVCSILLDHVQVDDKDTLEVTAGLLKDMVMGETTATKDITKWYFRDGKLLFTISSVKEYVIGED